MSKTPPPSEDHSDWISTPAGMVEWARQYAETHDLWNILDKCEQEAAAVLRRGKCPVPKPRSEEWTARMTAACARWVKARTDKARDACNKELSDLKEELAPKMPANATLQCRLARKLWDEICSVRQRLSREEARDTDISFLRIGRLAEQMGLAPFEKEVQRGKQMTRQCENAERDDEFIRLHDEAGKSYGQIAKIHNASHPDDPLTAKSIGTACRRRKKTRQDGRD